jgi:DNA-binding beta-propeller fold protein YncE
MAPSAWAEEVEPLFVFIPSPPPFVSSTALPPPIGVIDGPCGAAVNSEGHFYISDYYHDAVDIWKHEGEETYPGSGKYVEYFYEPEKRPPAGEQGYISQIAPVDAIDGPCALAIDDEGNVYINDYHRRVIKNGADTIIAGQGVDSTHPTGVAVDPTTGTVYVDARTYIAVYEADGTPVMDGPNPLRIGLGSSEDSLEDGYGIAYSTYPGTEGDLYVPDAATNTVKIYDPSVDKVNPIDEIDGSGTPLGHFVSLRDAAIAIDRASGEVYVADDLQPLHTEKPEALIQVFDATGTYEGHLPDKVDDALPVGLAVDNSSSPRFTGFTYIPPSEFALEESTIRIPNGTQGMVYVTSGNTTNAAIYNYAPDSATTEEARPGAFLVTITVAGEGTGLVRSSLSTKACGATCDESVPAGGQVTLTAMPGSESAFAGWSGACTGSAPSCTIKVDDAASVRARFDPVAGPMSPAQASPSASPAVAAVHHRRHVRRHRHHRHHKHGRHHRATKR